VPGVNYEDERVWFDAKDYQEAYDGMVGLTSVATRNYPNLLTQLISRRADGAALLLEYDEALSMRWFDMESGRYTPPASPPAAPRKYHGAR
jgi:hypothetical protein